MPTDTARSSGAPARVREAPVGEGRAAPELGGSLPAVGVRGPAAAPVFVDWCGDGSVAVVDLALACCAIESELAAPHDAPRLPEPPPGCRVVAVVSGTLTDALAPALRAAIQALPDPFVVAFGGCACIGGPYWDSYSVTKGVDQLVAVDAFVPGCPPPPGALDEVVHGVRDGSLLSGRDARPAIEVVA